jgi:NAD(P)H-hydrate epimerase
MKIANINQMQNIDRRAIEIYGIPSITLMENAGIAATSHIVRFLKENPKFNRLSIICGKGNNGGDGFVIARHLSLILALDALRIFLIGKEKDLRNDSLINFKILKKMGLEIFELANIENLSVFKKEIKESDIIIDAIFGTGLSKNIEGLEKDIILYVNDLKKYVFAIDISSGINGNTGYKMNCAINANQTITLCLPKIGHFIGDGADSTGRLYIHDISIPKTCIDDEKINLELITEEFVNTISKKRKNESHKGTYGHLLIVAGSKGKFGATKLASLAALRAGCGLVTLACPESIFKTIQKDSFEWMTEALPDNDGILSKNSINKIIKLMDKCDALVIGPGISVTGETIDLIQLVIKNIKKPICIDADGINAIAQKISMLENNHGNLSLTPHPGEFSRLINKPTSEILKNRIQEVENFITHYNISLVLKGYHSIIARNSGNIFINSTGNSGMATAGMGDVLSGMIGSLLAQKYKNIEALIIATYVHGLAGDIGSSKLGKISLIARDLIKYIPNAFKISCEK